MSGHSKWHSIKHKKALTDNKRGAVFTKLGRNITVAAKGGGDPAMNPALALAIEKAKAANMPNDPIDRAIKKGTGELKDDSIIQEVYYEGYAPGKIPVIVYALTDNTNRTVAHVRHAFSKQGGSMGNTGTVSHLFEKKGMILATLKDLALLEDTEMSIMDSGANDYEVDSTNITIFTEVADLNAVEKLLREGDLLRIEDSELRYFPITEGALASDVAEQYMAFIAHLEESDDIQEIYSTVNVE